MENKKRLLVLTSTFPRWKNDTVPPFIYELSKRLTNKFEVFILAPGYPGAKDFEIMDNMQIYRFRYFLKKYEKLAGEGILPNLKKNKLTYLLIPFFLLGEYLALRKLIKKIKPDIIHAHWVIPQGIVTYFGSGKIPYIITSHGSDLLGIKGFISIKRKILKKAKKITVVSEFLKKKIIKKIDDSLIKKIEVIPMGVDTKLFSPDKKDDSIRKKYNIKKNFILYVGRISEEKGIKYLILAMPEVIRKFPESKLIIIGEGQLKERLKEKCRDLRIEKNVLFLGGIKNEELPKFYATADLFVCPSLREGSPLSYIESLSCNTPIIIGDLPVGRELVGNDPNRIVKQKNPPDISRKIINFFTNNQIKNIDQKRLSNKFDWEIISKKYGEILK